MTAKLDKTIKRELDLDGKLYTVAISPDGIKVTEKGKRNGQELSWASIVSGEASQAATDKASEASLTAALQASVGAGAGKAPAKAAAKGADPVDALAAALKASLGVGKADEDDSRSE